VRFQVLTATSREMAVLLTGVSEVLATFINRGILVMETVYTFEKSVSAYHITRSSIP
jgi:hypothetical protein